MKLVILALILLFLAWVVFRSRKSGAKRGKIIFDRAASLERAGNFEDACFHYAVSARSGYQADLSRRKVKELWDAHGPFLFSDQVQKFKKDNCRDACCGEELEHMTISHIHQWVKEKG